MKLCCKGDFFFGLFCFCLGLCLWLPGQEEAVKEKVEVVNVEVPVRVFLDGAPVAGLTRGDFQLYEGKEKQIVNGFYVRKKKLAVQDVAIKANAQAVPGRYFVLVFRITEYNEQLKKGIDTIFENILRDNDRLLVMANEHTLELNKDIGQARRRELLDRILSEEALKARQNLEKYFLAITNDLDQTKLAGMLEQDGSFASQPQRIIDFLEKYLNTWEEFKKKHLVPDLDKFYNFARHLEKIKGEKWVFNFYQIEMFPKIKISGELRRKIRDLVEILLVARPEDNAFGRIIAQLLERINRELNMADEFPIEDVGKMLVRVDTTYHSFIIGVERNSISEDLEYKRVASDIQNSLQQIARQSGGEVVFSGNVGSALHSLIEREDIYYVLTYEPTHPTKKGKVRVTLANPKYRLFYDDKVRADYIGDYIEKKKVQDPTLQLSRMQWVEKKLQLEIVDFKMAATTQGPRGNLNMAVRVLDEQNRPLFDQNRTFLGRDGHAAVAIDFSFLKTGRYMFLVDVRDLFSGKAATDVLQVTVD